MPHAGEKKVIEFQVYVSPPGELEVMDLNPDFIFFARAPTEKDVKVCCEGLDLDKYVATTIGVALTNGDPWLLLVQEHPHEVAEKINDYKRNRT